MTHNELVQHARKWLRKSQRCAVVVSEITSQCTESPDALGWYGLNTHLVECKTSRADFKADAKKIFRSEHRRGLGNYRWYLTPANLIAVDELPAKWGLVEVVDRKARVIRKAEHWTEKNASGEASILLSIIRRIGQTEPQGCSIQCYTYKTQNRTVLETVEDQVMSES